MKLKISISFLITLFSQSFAYNLEKIEPPFWWAGFKSDELQLMVHGKDISKLKPKIDGSGIIIGKVHSSSVLTKAMMDWQQLKMMKSFKN